jgi:hypothetical protein
MVLKRWGSTDCKMKGIADIQYTDNLKMKGIADIQYTDNLKVNF